jgi:hypothetical protein
MDYDLYTVEQSGLCLPEMPKVISDGRRNQVNQIGKTKNEMIIKLVMCLIMFFMIGGIFLLGRFDPEEENEAVVNEKNEYGNKRR